MTEREKKKKIMADRVKPLEVEHLSDDKLRWKIYKSWRYNWSACKLISTNVNCCFGLRFGWWFVFVQGDSTRAVAGAFQPGGDQIRPLWEAQKTKIWGQREEKRTTSADDI